LLALVLCRAERALLRRLLALGLLGRARLQLESPFQRLRRCPDLHLPARGLESEHLHFHRISARRKIREFVPTGFIGGSQHPPLALRRNHCGARNWLRSELHRPGLRAQRRSQDNQENG
jgi:hypothetical protein